MKPYGSVTSANKSRWKSANWKESKHAEPSSNLVMRCPGCKEMFCKQYLFKRISQNHTNLTITSTIVSSIAIHSHKKRLYQESLRESGKSADFQVCQECKSYSCNSGAVRPTENQPSVVLPDRERAAARVKTHMHRKSCQKDSQHSLSITFYDDDCFSIIIIKRDRERALGILCLCRSHSTTVFSPLRLVCEYQHNGYTAVQGTAARSAHALPKNLTLQQIVRPGNSSPRKGTGEADANLANCLRAAGPRRAHFVPTTSKRFVPQTLVPSTGKN